MSMSPLILLGWFITLAILGLAWVRGGVAERIGALIILVSALSVLLIHQLVPKDFQTLLLLAVDGCVAAGFLVLALRYASVWLGGAMLLQAVQFSLHAYYLVAELPHDRRYALINNIDSLGVLLCVLAGTLLAWRKQTRLAK